ncbi:MAG: hypothetical protein Q7J12_03890, partial [Syntrophales bacterium]|nr:hypothetical protein [Syntrophales bacterium]
MEKIDYRFYGTSNKEEFWKARKAHPALPKSILIKTDLVRRGVKFSDRVKRTTQDPDNNYVLTACILFGQHKEEQAELVPQDFFLDDGTLVLVTVATDKNDPYLIDIGDDGQFYAYFNDGTPLARIHFNERPSYYGKKTRSGEWMQFVGFTTGSDSVLFCPLRYCHYWSGDTQCVFCDITHNAGYQKKLGRGFKTRATPEDFYDTMVEVLKDWWRWRHFLITGGANPKDDHDREFNYHLEIIKALSQAGKDSGVERVPLFLIGSPVKHDQFVQFKEAGLDSYGIYFEIWD